MTSMPDARGTAALSSAYASPAPPGWISWQGMVLRNERLRGKRHHYAVVELPDESPMPRSGQFYMLAPGGVVDDFHLRRPMSVARAWREGGSLRVAFLYTVMGAGTRALAAAHEEWKLLGPLGHGYEVPPGAKPVLVGGGRGIAPLVLLAEECAVRGQAIALLNGARNAEEFVSAEDLQAAPFAVGSLRRQATEDGSIGRRGRVLDALEDEEVAAWAEDPSTVFYSCGPHGLLEAVGREAARRGRPAQVALEAHMACGAGICRSCVVPRREGSRVPAEATNGRYILACLDGPVVDPATVDWGHTP
jgi:dihydroorotate dehydrogenase electron transfer subunit